MKRRISRGFTLIEILIVVIILGILAAIVIPQFTNASSQAKVSSVQSTLQTVRSQLELFKLNHSDSPPNTVAGLWDLLDTISTTGDTTAPVGTETTLTSGTFGPYVQQAPVNPLNGYSTVVSTAGATAGWVYTYSNNQYTIYATDTTGTGTLTY